jgi:hypothetical protein
MKIIEQTAEKLTVSTPLVSAKVEIVERLHFGAGVDDKWRAGEHQVIDEVRSAGGISQPQPNVDGYSDEAFAVVSAAREFFGNVRALGPSAREAFPKGQLVMVLVPEVVEAPPAPKPERRSSKASES